MDSILVRCEECGAQNKVLLEKINSNPRCGRCRSLLKITDKAVEIDYSDFKKEVQEHMGFVLLYLWSPTCPHCIRTAPLMDDVAKIWKGLVKVVKINVLNNPEIAQMFQIKGVPTMIVLKNGEPLNRVAGALPLDQINAFLHRATNS